MALSLAIGVLTAGGLYLMLQREMVRIVFGFLLLSHAFNLILIAAGVTDYRLTPIVGIGDPAATADPLPQAFVLTAIVIAVATAIFMLALVVAGQRADPVDDADRTDTSDRKQEARAQEADEAEAEIKGTSDSGTELDGGPDDERSSE
ncbi:sodium:proton antiporter [Dietzia lutea]|uniref:sodium:proton antiporter n=1 Tax=Dietzia lutea TaxID=546160 RepID=UPI000D55AA1F|nr:cation:proton antiporter subunit C [Dietzia lutea]